MLHCSGKLLHLLYCFEKLLYMLHCFDVLLDVPLFWKVTLHVALFWWAIGCSIVLACYCTCCLVSACQYPPSWWGGRLPRCSSSTPRAWQHVCQGRLASSSSLAPSEVACPEVHLSAGPWPGPVDTTQQPHSQVTVQSRVCMHRDSHTTVWKKAVCFSKNMTDVDYITLSMTTLYLLMNNSYLETCL